MPRRTHLQHWDLQREVEGRDDGHRAVREPAQSKRRFNADTHASPLVDGDEDGRLPPTQQLRRRPQLDRKQALQHPPVSVALLAGVVTRDAEGASQVAHVVAAEVVQKLRANGNLGCRARTCV